MQSVELDSWFRKESKSQSRESVMSRLRLSAIGYPTCPEEETVLDCRSHSALPVPW